MLRWCVLAFTPMLVTSAACSSRDREQPCAFCDAGQADVGPDLAPDLPLPGVEAGRDVGPDRPRVDAAVDATVTPLDASVIDLRGPLSVFDAPLLSFHDFDNGLSDGWDVKTWPGANARSSDWSVIGGDTGSVFSESLLDTSTWRIAFDGIDLISDQVVEAKMRVPEFYAKEPSYVAALFGRYDPEIDTGYFVALRGDGSLIVRRRELGQNASWRDGVNVGIEAGVWYTVRLEIIGSAVNAFLNGAPVYQVVDPNPLGAGTVGLGTYGASLEVDQVFITEP
jgi:hypothetical protein